MNHAHIRAILEGVIPEVRAAIEAATAPLIERIRELEAGKPARGDIGPAGKDGRDGIDGKDGAPGLQGERGERGEKGEDGAAGRDGLPGVPGRDGKDGINGKDGAAGRDGLGYDDMDVAFEDGGRYRIERYLRDGVIVKEVRIKTATPIFRGRWDEKHWDRGDVVMWGGSAFCAVRDTKAKPEINDDWTIFVRRGRDGKNGKDGDRGPAGAKGEKGDRGDRGFPV